MDWLGEASRGRRYPLLPEELKRQLERIPLSGGLYRPCGAVLDDGSRLDRVYFAEAEPWFLRWGIWPDEDRKREVDVRRVRSVFESPSRLPPDAAGLLYDAGESGMGCHFFTLRFRDGSSASWVSGNALDFVEYPNGQSAATVAEVIPHGGRDDPDRRVAPDYCWCLYSKP